MDHFRNMQIAQTIVQQMGGFSRLKAMVGANDFSYGAIDHEGYAQPYAQFKFKMNPKLKSCRVIYDEGLDLYIMQFLGRTGKIHKELNEVYCDELIKNFETTTGLALRLF